MQQADTYFLLDAARSGYEAVLEANEVADATNSERDCLYTINNKNQHLISVAPYLYAANDAEMLNWFLYNGWGKAWGFLGLSDSPFAEIRHHFRKFLTVYDEDRKQMYFRFYDPRVLRAYLSTCTPRQLKDFFGPIAQFICEAKDNSELLLFSIDKTGMLQTRQMLFTDKFTGTPPEKISDMDTINTDKENETEQKENTKEEEKITIEKPRRRFFF